MMKLSPVPIFILLTALLSSPSWGEGNRYIDAYSSMGESGFEIVDFIFKICVILLADLADFIGISYELLNIIIFIFAQPILILLFFILWRIERRKNCFLERLNQSNKDPA